MKVKIGGLVMIISLLSVMVMCILLVMQYSRAILRRAGDHIDENIDVVSDRTLSVLRDGELCANNVMLFTNALSGQKGITKAAKENQFRAVLNQNVIIFPQVSSIVYLSDNGAIYATDDELRGRKDEIIDSPYYRRIYATKGQTLLMDADSTVMQSDERTPITMAKHIVNISTGKSLGYLFVNLDIAYFMQSLQSDLTFYYLYDTQGNCITLLPKQQEPGSEYATLSKSALSAEAGKLLRRGSDSYLIAKKTLDNYGWTSVGVTNVNRYNVSGSELIRLLFLTFLFIFALVLASAIVTSRIVTRPLEKLQKGAEQIAAGDLSVRFYPHTQDEIGKFADAFNYMTSQNQQLIKRIDEEARKKREYELALIQEQVKPHFLYNTLDIIIMLIEMGRTREAQRVTRKLANYYKNSLSGSEEIVSLQREKQIISDYLDLQMMRYADKFTYEIDIPAELGCASIPKMTLQPIVENAIYHGIKLKEGCGSIRITAHELTGEDGKGILIIVADDGIGMDEHTLQGLRSILEEQEPKAGIGRTTDGGMSDNGSIGMSGRGSSNGGMSGSGEKPESGRKHFGVYSCAHRIQLYYGKEYGIRIESEYGVGTRVLIHIPMQVRKQDNANGGGRS